MNLIAHTNHFTLAAQVGTGQYTKLVKAPNVAARIITALTKRPIKNLIRGITCKLDKVRNYQHRAYSKEYTTYHLPTLNKKCTSQFKFYKLTITAGALNYASTLKPTSPST